MKSVLVTGGSRGIGKAIVERFLKENYQVYAPDRSELSLDIDGSVENFLLKHVHETFDVVVNNAGINDINILENVTDEELTRMIAVNFVSPVKLLRGLIPQMKNKKYGRIINIASVWAVVSKEGRSVYSATKNAMHGITNTIALELAPYNILVNTVCPGFTLTELTRQNNSDEEISEICREIPLQRMAEPSEIAEFVYFLGSDNNTYITGQKFCIDGGYTAR